MSRKFVFKDPLLYLASVFLLGNDLSAKNKARIFTDELIPLIQTKSGLDKPPEKFQPRHYLSAEIWNVEKEINDSEQLKVYAKSHSDSAALFLGIDELRELEISEIDDWVDQKAGRINSTYWNDDELKKLIRHPNESGVSENRLRIVGQTYVLIAEVDNWTVREWRNFAVNRYSQAGWVKFEWGTMSFIVDKDEEIPRFELFFEKNYKKQFESFLYRQDLSAFLTGFLKISQFILHRFRENQENLRLFANTIEEWRGESTFNETANANRVSIIKYSKVVDSQKLRLGALEQTVRFGNNILLNYSSSISDLAEYIHTTEVNINIIEQLFLKNKGKISNFTAGHFWYQQISLLREQMNVEQKYHEIIYAHLQRHFEALKLFSEIKKSHFEYLLALIAVVLGAIVGLGQILASGLEPFWKGVMVTLISICIVALLILGAILTIERVNFNRKL